MPDYVLPDTPFLSEIQDQVVVRALKARAESINQWAKTEHNADGSHGDITTGEVAIGNRLVFAEQGTFTPNAGNAARILNQDLDGPQATVWRLVPTAAITVTGIYLGPNGHDGGFYLITNDSAFTITLDHENTSTLPSGSRLACPDSTDQSLEPGDTAVVFGDQHENRYRVLGILGAGGVVGVGGMPPIVFTALNNEYPAASFANFDTRNSRPILVFPEASDTEAVFSGVLPSTYAGGGLTARVWGGALGDTSGTLVWQGAFERINVSGLDIDADSFAAFQSVSVTVPGTAGHMVTGDIAFTDGSQMDSLAAGEAFRFKLRRDKDGGTDNLTDEAHFLRLMIFETA